MNDRNTTKARPFKPVPAGEGGLPTSQCPDCGYATDSSTHVGVENHEPRPGDLSVCINCGYVSIFNDILVLKPLPTNLWDQLHPETVDTLAKATAFIRVRGRIVP